ncbi:MAG: hypothetical protein AAF738_07440, partial [Bacteroidota bacterium]
FQDKNYLNQETLCIKYGKEHENLVYIAPISETKKLYPDQVLIPFLNNSSRYTESGYMKVLNLPVVDAIKIAAKDIKQQNKISGNDITAILMPFGRSKVLYNEEKFGLNTVVYKSRLGRVAVSYILDKEGTYHGELEFTKFNSSNFLSEYKLSF